MDISELALKLIFILLPGAIAAMIYERLTVHKEWTPFKFILHATIFGMLSYLSLQVTISIPAFVYNVFNKQYKAYSDLEIWETINGSKKIPYWEVLKACGMGIVISALATAITFYKILNKSSQILKLSNKYGDENLYSYFLNAKEIEFVYVRHIKNDLTYHGYVKSFSENDLISELVMSSVSVYRYTTSELLYEIDQIYLSFNKSEIIIEKANLKQDVKQEPPTPEAAS